MNHYCPNCQREFYNPRQTHCNSCGAEIPLQLRFSREDSAAFDQRNAKFHTEFERLIALDKEWREYFAKKQ